MPSRRFFALLKAKRKLECVDAIERIDETLIASHNVNMKWYESLRERWVNQLSGFELKNEETVKVKEYTDEEIKETQAVVLELFRQRKQFMGYGGQ